jgi:phosphatidate cytidylyltransferase
MTGVFSRTSMIIAAAMLLLMSIALLYERKDIFDIVPLISVTLLLPLQMTRHGTADFNRKSSLRLLGLIYWGWLPMHFVLIQKPKGGFGAIVLLCMLIATNDNGAYYTGKLLGKNSPKLLPSVSPGKTWTGFIGGGVITIGAAAALGYTLPGSNVWQRMLLGLIVAIVGPIGDLLESAMKRDAGVKDSGKLIPGHGGVMDRFDSWAFTAPLYYYFLLAYGWL